MYSIIVEMVVPIPIVRDFTDFKLFVSYNTLVELCSKTLVTLVTQTTLVTLVTLIALETLTTLFYPMFPPMCPVVGEKCISSVGRCRKSDSVD